MSIASKDFFCNSDVCINVSESWTKAQSTDNKNISDWQVTAGTRKFQELLMLGCDTMWLGRHLGELPFSTL
jgi:hypothetical protein